ncbi:MAG: DUF6319 family protein [Sciscionella sp.]
MAETPAESTPVVAEEATDTTAGSAASEPGTDDTAAANEPESGGHSESPRRRGRPRKQSTARKTRTVELMLTVTGTAEGEWQADLKHGTERIVSGLRIQAAAVARAAKELHPDISTAIDEVIDTAREQHRSRLEQLEAEVAQVKQALAELED